MARFGFNDGFYTSQSVNADCQMTMNLYPEQDESGAGKGAILLYHTPGTKVFVDLNGGQVRGEITINGRGFAVCDGNFFEIFANGNKNQYGPIAQDLNMVSLAAGEHQILIASAGVAYVFDMVSNSLAPVDPAQLSNVAQVAYSDGFFIALFKNSSKIATSALEDATSWAGTDVTSVNEFPDQVLSMAILHREIWLQGPKASTVYEDAGTSPFPYQVNTGAGVIDTGSAAAFGFVNADNSLFWIGQDSRGAGIAYRADGYKGDRISTHAIEFAWSQYPTISDAIGYGYQDQGHTFIIWRFPSANATWVYDAATQRWHQRGMWDGIKFNAHPSQCHMYAFGKHLVGDWASGKIYDMSINYQDDAGTNIRRVRRSPHIAQEDQWMFFDQVQMMIETGLGPQPPLLDGNGDARGPIASLRWSKDYGHNWSDYRDIDCGQAGEFRTRAVWRRLGAARDMVFELSMSDPIPWRIIDAFVIATGYTPSERISDQLRKVS